MNLHKNRQLSFYLLTSSFCIYFNILSVSVRPLALIHRNQATLFLKKFLANDIIVSEIRCDPMKINYYQFFCNIFKK